MEKKKRRRYDRITRRLVEGPRKPQDQSYRTKKNYIAKRESGFERTEKRGRPRKYDPEIIIEKMIEWAKLESSINFSEFCADNKYLPELIWRLDKESKPFHLAYSITKMRLAERRERLVNCEMLNNGTFQRYQHGLDPFLKKEELELKKQEAKIRALEIQGEQMNLVKLAQMASEGKINQDLIDDIQQQEMAP